MGKQNALPAERPDKPQADATGRRPIRVTLPDKGLPELDRLIHERMRLASSARWPRTTR